MNERPRNICRNFTAGALALLIIGIGGACRGGPKTSAPEPYPLAKDTKPQALGVVITTLNRLLEQWSDAMLKPETKRNLELRRALANEIEKTTVLRFDELRRELETSAVMRNREIIAAALGFSKKPQALNPILSALVSDPVPAVRERALLGLSRLKDVNTPVDLVASRLSPDFSEGEQWNASLALKNLAEAGARMDPALATLRDGLKNLNPAIRVHCAAALGFARDSSSTQQLLVALKDERTLAAAAAANALGRIGDPGAVAGLIDALGAQDYAVREQARKALTRINGSEDLGQEAGPWRRWQQKVEMTKSVDSAPGADSRPADPGKPSSR